MAKPTLIRSPKTSTHAFIGIHGDPGVGKTRFIWGSPGKLLVIRPPQEHIDSVPLADRRRAQEAVVNDWDDMATLLEHLRSPDGAEWDWVWVDNAQGIFDVCIDDIWDTVLLGKPSRAEFDLDKGEYGINMNRFSRWMRHVVGPDQFNFGYTTHSEVAASPDLDEDGDPIVKLMPWIQGKGMPTKCAGYMNVVGYMTKANIKNRGEVRVLRTEGSTGYYAKDQFNAFGGKVVEPTMPKVIELIKKSGGPSPTTTRRRVAVRKGAKKA